MKELIILISMSAVLLLSVIFCLIERYHFNKAIDRLIAIEKELKNLEN